MRTISVKVHDMNATDTAAIQALEQLKCDADALVEACLKSGRPIWESVIELRQAAMRLADMENFGKLDHARWCQRTYRVST
jgi:hypothetical protein